MTPSRPYLLRGLHEWIVDNQKTPHILVNVEAEGVAAPKQFADGEQLVLNISPTATRGLAMDNDGVSFEARFGGQPMQVYIPIEAVQAIYARENGRGMIFTIEDDGGGGPSSDDSNSDSPKPGLRVVK